MTKDPVTWSYSNDASLTMPTEGGSGDKSEPEPQPAQAETPGLVVSGPDPVTVREGGSAAYTVVLDSVPADNVVVVLSSDNRDVTAQPASLTFTPDNWQMAQTVTVSVSEDDDRVDDQAVISHAASGGNYDGVTAPAVTVSVTDDDSDREILRTSTMPPTAPTGPTSATGSATSRWANGTVSPSTARGR